MEQNKITVTQVWFGIFLVVLISLAYFVANRIISNKESDTKTEIVSQVVNEVILKKPSCPDTRESFEDFKTKGQIVTLVKNLNTYGGANGNFINEKYVLVNSSGSGSQLACGYLYVKAHGKNGRPLQLQWEHPYIKPGQFGGHIVVGDSIIPNNESGGTELLFNLGKIQYRVQNSDSEVRKADWSALLNVTNKIEFTVSLNTTDISGTLDEVSIAYQCWSPETGQVTSDCKLSVE